ncbi:MAG: 3'-5' exonuclease, partial [Cutibacterium avidum]|nr:3'-5' exonuclease [Cutibacterium avidum]
VTLDHRFTPQTYKFIGEELAGIIASTVARDYIDPALDRGEKVAFLAYSRREVDAVEAALEQRYPGRTIANLVSERPFDTTIFSNYVKMLWNDVLMVQPADAAFTMTQDIMSNLDRLSRGRISPAAEKAMRALVSQWWIQNAAAVNGWVKLVAAGHITAREFFARLRSNVLDFEIRHNSVHQNMVNQRNRERKERKQNADAQLIVSTIHGVKGLEFDNVVVIHRDSPDMSQEMRRLFYVAFTRAAGTEYVLSYGSQKDSPIVSDYELVVDTLEKAEARAAIIAAGGDPDAPDPDDAPVGASAA